MYIENEYVGSQEYVIFFKNGQHEVREIINHEGDYDIVHTGHYESCKTFLYEKQCAYVESCM